MCGKYDPDIHHRHSIRLNWYDYSQEGWYYVTICAQNQACLFGNILNDQMQLNKAGLMVKTWWRKVSSKFPSVQTDEYIIMPNHFHGIVHITCQSRDKLGQPHDKSGQLHRISGQPHGVAPTLGDVVNWFKTMTTNEYIRGVKQNKWPPFAEKLWQRNYYEHIIRNEEDLNHVRQYIVENPLNWGTDEENPDAISC